MGRVVGEYFSGESKEEDKKVEKEEDEWEEYQSCSYSFDNKGFLFYFNTCDSKTVLQDTYIDCVENRGVYFDPTKPHSSSSCTNVKARFSLNVNYI